MPFHTTAVQVMLASPGDTSEQRAEILAAVARWNGRYAQMRGFVITPWLYELHATPMYGERAQSLINQQGVDKSDVVIVIFGNKLGTPTGVDVSGTVEEMRRAHALDKRVHVYFSSADVPQNKITDAVALQEFKTQFEEAQLGYYDTYTDARDLSLKVIEALETDMAAFDQAPAPKTPAGVALQVTFESRTPPEAAFVPSVHTLGVASKAMEIAVRRPPQPLRQLLISNVGEVDAEAVQIKVVGPPGRPASVMGGHDDGWTLARDLTVGSVFGVPCNLTQAGPVNVDVMTRWVEDGQMQEKTFTTQMY